MCLQQTPTEYIWATRFGLYLCTQREDIEPLDAYTLGYQYVTLLPNLIREDPKWVVDEYLKGYYDAGDGRMI